MKKIIIFLAVFLASFAVANSQNLITKDKEEQIKKNLSDYRHLIAEHKKTVKDNTDLKAKIESLSKEIDDLNKKLSNCDKPKTKPQSKFKLFILKVKKFFSGNIYHDRNRYRRR